MEMAALARVRQEVAQLTQALGVDNAPAAPAPNKAARAAEALRNTYSAYPNSRLSNIYIAPAGGGLARTRSALSRELGVAL
jgi:hypothetical protein